MSTIAIQPLFLGAILLWAAGVKLVSRRGAIAARDTALTHLLGESLAPKAYRALGAAEAVVGLALLLPYSWLPTTLAAITLTAGFCGFLVYSRLATPESSCGCMGGKGAPVSWRSFARSGGMLAAAIATLWTTTTWPTALTSDANATIPVLVAQTLVFIALSAEFDGAWLVPLRRLRARWTHPLGGDTGEVPLNATVDQLHRSDVYRHVAQLLRTDVRETWDEDDWRIVCYGAAISDRAATAVFAVPLTWVAPESVKVAFVDDETSETLLRMDVPPNETERPQWALEQATA